MECFLVAFDNGDTFAFNTEGEAYEAALNSPFEYKIFSASLNLIGHGFGEYHFSNCEE